MTDLAARLTAALSPTYRIEHELGGGGMSRVFLAEEPALGRRVVIKVLPPEMGAGVNQERFRREVQLAATLQHPNIVPLLTAGSAGDLLYYVMPYVEGESLRTRLARDGELPVAEAARLLREVADALAYAHDRGIVHRDIKPGNVMLSSGHALVTDFGIAKAVTASSGGPSVTSLGLALGTPAYMSPEQASGDPSVDHRADLYALGATAYEMLTGQPPFVATNPQSLLAAHVTRTPERLGALRPAVPTVLEAAVMRCLEKRPADRWQQARELFPPFDAATTPSGGTTPTGTTALSSGAAAALRHRHPVRVAFLFGLAALAVLFATWWLEHRLGLPDWVLVAAGVLLVVGMPIVLVAAQREREQLRNTAERAIPVPTGPAGRLKTLRGAIAGGGLAFMGLAAGTAAFMGLRTAGVGPFATLVSAGVLKEGTRLVLADFANSTPDSTLAGSITEAFRIDLSQSRTVRLLDGRQVSAALQRMERAADSGLAAPVALELALREGAAAVVAGEIAPLAGGYVLSVRLLSAGDGGTLLADREIADDATGIIPAVEALSKRLRERIGESLRTIRAGEPLAQVTTASLEALRLYSLADRAANAAKVTEAVRLYEQAIGVDSTFGMAWRRLAVVLGNSGRDPVRRTAAAQRAYELRDRLPPREGLLAEAYYYQAIRKQNEATDAYRRLLAAWPDDPAAQNNLAILLMEQQQFTEAEALLRGLADSGSTVTSTYQNLVEVRLRAGNIAGAESAVAVFRQRVPEAGVPARTMRREIAMIQGRFPEALAVVREGLAETDAEARARSQATAVPLLRLLGRWQEASQEGGQAVRALAAVDQVEARRLAVQQEIDQVITEAYLLGRTEEGRTQVDALLRQQPLDSIRAERRPYLTLVWAEAILGRPARAREHLESFRQMATPAEAGDLKAGEGMVAYAEERWADAIPLLRASAAASGWYCRTCSLVQIGEAFDRLGLTDSARVAYETYATDLATGNIGQDSDLPVSYLRLGEIYETRGERERAIEYYNKLLDLWKDADPLLQPKIRDLRERVGRLAGEGSGR